MPNILVPLIEKQTAILFLNLETTLNSLTVDQLTQAGSWGWPLAQQVFHLLRSMDQWFISPFGYSEPEHLKQAQDKILAKKELFDYCSQVKTKVEHYLFNLSDAELADCPPNCQYTRIELILGQYRHFMYHIGLIQGGIRSVTGHSPGYTGLEPRPLKP